MSYEIQFNPNGDYIRASVYCDDGRAAPSTGVKHEGLPLSKLPRKSQRVLDRIKLRVEEYVANQQQAGKGVIKKEIVRVVKEAIGKAAPVQYKTAGDVFTEFLAKAKKGLVTNKKGIRYSESSIALIGYSIDLVKTDPLYNVLITDLKTNHFDEFRARLANKTYGKIKKKKYTANALETYSNILGTIITRTFRLGWHETDLTKQKGTLWAVGEDVDYAIYYSEEELRTIYNTDFGNEAMNEKRDIFIFGCYTCLRHSDYYLTDYVMAVDGNILRLKNKKTGNMVEVPLHPLALIILKKYDYKLPKINYSNMRKSVKQLAHKAGFDKPCLFTRIEGGKPTQEYKPKWELTTTHTMRRSFATNAFLSGMPERMIMKIGGWKSYQSFERYLRMSGLDIANLIQEMPFYKNWKWD